MSAVSVPYFKGSKPLPALLILTLIFGTLDILDDLLFWGLSMDVGPIDVFQGIASGVLGSSAFHGGTATATLGALIQYCGFFCLLGIYYLALTRSSVLAHKPVLYGLGYGLASYLVVHYLILPMTAFHIVPGFYPAAFANGLLAQTVFIGLPSAFLAGAWKMGEAAAVRKSSEAGHASPTR